MTEETETKAEDVAPCPFCGACGSDCEVMQDHVSCRVCGATGPYSSYSDGEPEDYEPPTGLELWNNRAV